jgi:mono/diheme cytochrome c family protein
MYGKAAPVWWFLVASLVRLVVGYPVAAADSANTRETAASSSTAPTSRNLDLGHGLTLYSQYCASCHQANGEGVTGVFPPLKGSGVVNKADASKHIDIVLRGLSGARASGVMYANSMPAFAAMLSDADIAAIVDYERAAWGNHGSPVTVAQVTAARAKVAVN